MKKMKKLNKITLTNLILIVLLLKDSKTLLLCWMATLSYAAQASRTDSIIFLLQYTNSAIGECIHNFMTLTQTQN